jgi:hypothetical protein
MKIIEITGWLPGFGKISMNRLLREEFGYSLSTAKNAVDAILDGQKIILSCAEENEIKICSKLSEIRVIFKSDHMSSQV